MNIIKLGYRSIVTYYTYVRVKAYNIYIIRRYTTKKYEIKQFSLRRCILYKQFFLDTFQYFFLSLWLLTTRYICMRLHNILNKNNFKIIFIRYKRKWVYK